MRKFIPFLMLFVAIATVVPASQAQGNSECEFGSATNSVSFIS